jgi:hypothetical protein
LPNRSGGLSRSDKGSGDFDPRHDRADVPTENPGAVLASVEATVGAEAALVGK